MAACTYVNLRISASAGINRIYTHYLRVKYKSNLSERYTCYGAISGALVGAIVSAIVGTIVGGIVGAIFGCHIGRHSGHYIWRHTWCHIGRHIGRHTGRHPSSGSQGWDVTQRESLDEIPKIICSNFVKPNPY